jgi:CubicO group peptidase (beta-lactamase class C family)
VGTATPRLLEELAGTWLHLFTVICLLGTSAMSNKLRTFAVIFLCAQLLAAQKTLDPALPPEVQRHIERVISCLQPMGVVKDNSHPCATLSERMTALHVPGVSIYVIHQGASWGRGFGVTQLGGKPVSPGTLFQAGSISKPVAAMAALHLVQEKKLTLDADINSELVTWKLPTSPAANGKVVTLRELLTHTAGLTVHGFPGYAANEPVPSLTQVLDGQKPANTPPIRIESEPGSRWSYSGGGFTVMQQALLDVTGEPFPKLMHDTVLVPLGMVHSTYQQPLPRELQASAATPYDDNDSPIPGGAHTYPEMAAAGLWTTAPDLGRFAEELERSLQGEGNLHGVLTSELARQMVAPGKGRWGLGLGIGGSDADPYFIHGGDDAGFENLLVEYENHLDGAIVMTNAQGGTRLADEIMQSIATEYGWQDFHLR